MEPNPEFVRPVLALFRRMMAECPMAFATLVQESRSFGRSVWDKRIMQTLQTYGMAIHSWSYGKQKWDFHQTASAIAREFVIGYGSTLRIRDPWHQDEPTDYVI